MRPSLGTISGIKASLAGLKKVAAIATEKAFTARKRGCNAPNRKVAGINSTTTKRAPSDISMIRLLPPRSAATPANNERSNAGKYEAMATSPVADEEPVSSNTSHSRPI